MANGSRRDSSSHLTRGFISTLAFTLAVALVLPGCGGDGDKKRVVDDDEPPASSFIQAPPIGYAPRVVALFTDLVSTSRSADLRLGPLVTPRPLTAPQDAPVLLGVTNTAVTDNGGLVIADLAWSDIGSDVDKFFIELRCTGNVGVTAVHSVFQADELIGLADDDTRITLRLDPLNEDGGYELVIALGDRQGNISPWIRSNFLSTQLAGNPAFGQTTADLVATGGELAPQLGPTQVWIPTGGNTDDSISDGLEGSFPSRVSGNVSLYVQQPPGTNQITLTDVGTSNPRYGVIYGADSSFSYLFCRQGLTVDADCAGMWATIGVGRIIEEFRLGRLDKRLEISEVRVFLGGYDQNNPSAGISDPLGPRPPSCPVDAFPRQLINDFVVYIR